MTYYYKGTRNDEGKFIGYKIYAVNPHETDDTELPRFTANTPRDAVRFIHYLNGGNDPEAETVVNNLKNWVKPSLRPVIDQIENTKGN